MKTMVIDKDTKYVLSEDFENEVRTDWLEDKTVVSVIPREDVKIVYVRDRTAQDIKDADTYGGNLEDD